jgi:hypothetical protein
MKWFFIIIYLYSSYYTLSYAKKVWNEGNKFAACFISILGISVAVLGLIIKSAK